MDDYGKISYANSRKMLDRAAETREQIRAAAEQCERYPKDMLDHWLCDDVMKGVRSKTNQLLYEFAEKHDMSLHDVCMHFMPKYDYHMEPFDAKGNPSPMFNVDISLEPMPLELEQGPGYWKGKYFKLKEQIQKLIDDKAAETGELVFRIFFKYPESKDHPVWINGDDYKRFIMAWAGEERWVCEGEYNVPDGYRAISYEDGSKVKVEKIKED